MGGAVSRCQGAGVDDTDESYGIAEMFARARVQHRSRWTSRLRLRFSTPVVPSTQRQRGSTDIDPLGEARAALSALGGWHEDRHLRPQTAVEEVRERPGRRGRVIRRRNSSSAEEGHESPQRTLGARSHAGPERARHSSWPAAGPSSPRASGCEPRPLRDRQAALRLLARARRVVVLSSDGEQGERVKLLDKQLPATPPTVPTKTGFSSDDDEAVPVLFHTAQSYAPRTRMSVRGVFKNDTGVFKNGDSDADSYETICTPPPRPPGRAALRGEDSGDDDTVPVALRGVLCRAMKSLGIDDDPAVLKPSVLLPRPVPPGSPPTVRVRLRSKTSGLSPKLEPASALPLEGAPVLPGK